jgi:autonomous glycyl radical cofactor GrcA
MMDNMDDDGDDVQVLEKEQMEQLITQVEKASTLLMNVSNYNVSLAEEESVDI